MCESLWNNLKAGKLNPPGCDQCDGHGHIRIPRGEGQLGFKFEDCACLVEHESLQETISLWKKSNLGRRIIARYPLETWEEPTTEGLDFDTILSLIDAPSEAKNWLFLNGDTGCGKTYAAVIVAQIALLREKTTFFVNTAELLDALRPQSSEEAQTLRDVYMVKAKESDVLILDDIGQEKASEWVRERLFLIINHRWNHGKMTVFTSNYDIEHTRSHISEAVYSRIKGESLEIHLDTQHDKRLT